jgi:hypothetical protein
VSFFFYVQNNNTKKFQAFSSYQHSGTCRTCAGGCLLLVINKEEGKFQLKETYIHSFCELFLQQQKKKLETFSSYQHSQNIPIKSIPQPQLPSSASACHVPLHSISNRRSYTISAHAEDIFALYQVQIRPFLFL